MKEYIITIIGATLLSAMAGIIAPEKWRSYVQVITGLVIISCIIGTLVFTVISLPLNYFIVYPIYFKAFGGEAAILGMYQQIMGSVKNIFSALCVFNLPFTFVKGIICALVTILIYKPLSPILKGKD